MEYLLDTHIILWWLTDPTKIKSKGRKIIRDKNNKIYISAASFWEMGIKQSIGRITLPHNLIDSLLAEGFALLHITPEEGLGVSDLPFIHNDPFDRLLIIQAKMNDLIIITNDKQIKTYPVVTLDA